MKVAFFTNNYLPRTSGVAISIHSLKSFLEELGIKVSVFAPSYHPFWCNLEEKNVVRVLSLRPWWVKKFTLPLPLLSLRKIDQILKRWKPDIIHIHHPFLLGKMGLNIGIKYGIPVVFTYHTLYNQYVHYSPLGKNFSERWVNKQSLICANKSKVVIAPTELIKSYLKEQGVKSKIAVIPTGIDFTEFNYNYSFSQLEDFKNKLGISSNQKILLYVGRIALEKNIDFLIRVINNLVKSSKDIKLLIVGDGIRFKYYRQQVIQLKLDQQVIWAGLQPPEKLPLFYKIADLFVFPSKTDTQALVLYEALASALPIIAIDSLASRAIIQNGKNGFLVSEDINEFSNTILKNLSFKYEHRICLDEKEYSTKSVAQKTISLYQEILNNK